MKLTKTLIFVLFHKQFLEWDELAELSKEVSKRLAVADWGGGIQGRIQNFS